MSLKNYDVVISTTSVLKPEVDIISKRELEGGFLVNVRGDIFYKLSTKISAPLIVVDSLIDDNYFNKITWNFAKAMEDIKKICKEEELFLVTNKFNNDNLMASIKEGFKTNLVYEMESIKGLKRFLERNKNRKGIIINEFIGAIASRFIDGNNIYVLSICGSEYLLEENVKSIAFSNKKKAKIAANELEKLIREQYDSKKYIYVNHNKE